VTLVVYSRPCICICWGTVTLVVLFKCLESSMHVRLYTCSGTMTLVVLFKCLESSMHAFVHMLCFLSSS
jgi:hypothetical protein